MGKKKGQITPTLRQVYRAEYCAWLNALHRCHNPAHQAYHLYGDRGITVCDEWRKKETGFSTFFKDLGPRPSAQHSLERVDNNKGYSPENCVWADNKTQANNRRPPITQAIDFGLGFDSSKRGKSPLVEYQGRIQSIVAWGKELGIPASTLRQRLRRGMTVEQAFTATKGQLNRTRRVGVLAQITIH